MDWGHAVTRIGQTTLKESDVHFGIKDADRRRHLCVLGRVGSGRSNLITHMALQDIERGIGTIILDANGNATQQLIERLGEDITERLIYLNPSDAEHPYTWNLLDDVRALPENKREETLTRALRSVYGIYEEPFTKVLVPKLLDKKESTLVTFYLALTNEKYRERFFEGDENGMAELDSLMQENEDLVSQIEEDGKYIAKDTLVRNLLGQHNSKFNVHTLAEKGHIIVVDFSQIKMFPTRMTPIVRTFLEGADIGGILGDTPTSLYLHDCLRYLGEAEIEWAFASNNMVLTVADTIVQEGDKERREIALSKCGSIASFASHPMDRELVERAFYPYVDPDELTHLEKGELVVALTIDSVRARPFFAKTTELSRPTVSSIQDIIFESKEKYTTPRTEVDATHKAQRDDEREGGPPGGFQNAFKSIFAKRAQGAPTPPPKKEVTPEQKAPKKETAEQKEATKTPTKETKQEKKKEKKEVSESLLKQLVYVQPVTS